MKIKYNIKPVELNVENVDEIDFPDIRDRIIEKRGYTIEFTLRDLENNIDKLKKLKKELDAKIFHEKTVIENIEHHHPFVKEMSEQDLLTAWMYKQSKGERKMAEDKLVLVEEHLKLDEEELAEIITQVPDVSVALGGIRE